MPKTWVTFDTIDQALKPLGFVCYSLTTSDNMYTYKNHDKSVKCYVYASTSEYRFEYDKDGFHSESFLLSDIQNTTKLSGSYHTFMDTIKLLKLMRKS